MLFAICWAILLKQRTVLTPAHDDKIHEDIPKFGTSHDMYKMYEHQIKSKVMNDLVHWGTEQEDIDYSNSQFIVVMLMIVHIISWGLAKYFIGTKKVASQYEKMMFNKNYLKLSVILVPVNLLMAMIVFNKVVNEYDKMGAYFQLWIISDTILLFATHINIYVEFKANSRSDILKIRYIIDNAN